MPTLYIKCPTTGKPVSTGISVPLNFDKKGVSSNNVKCPHCQQMHNWDGYEAFFLEEKGK